jgi:hypothetical protein
MRFAVDISPAGRWGTPVLLAELAALAEDSGWDGVFCEDYLAFADRLDTYDVWITLGLMASATERVTLASIVTPLAWRQPWTVAAQATTVDQISRGRCVLGVGIGDNAAAEGSRFRAPMSDRERAAGPTKRSRCSPPSGQASLSPATASSTSSKPSSCLGRLLDHESPSGSAAPSRGQDRELGRFDGTAPASTAFQAVGRT